jgi:hypothetical protein
LVAFSALVPDGVTLNAVALDASRGARSTISGQAATRDALLAFKERLQGAPYVGEVELPLEHLLSRTDARFTLTMTLKFDQVPPL